MSTLFNTIRGAPPRIVRVVVVDVARRVHVPRIVPVAAIRTTQADILRFQPTALYSKLLQ